MTADLLLDPRLPLPAAVPAGARSFTLLPGERFCLPLQFFAADDEGRTEDPTETKKRKAREEGKVPKSQELSMGIDLLLTVWAIGLFGPFIMDGIREAFHYSLDNLNRWDISVGNLNSQILQFSLLFLKIIAPVAAVAIVAAIASNIVQVGFLFTWKPIAPKWNKIAFTPQKVWQRVFLSKQSMANLVKSSIKIVIVFAIGWLVVTGDMNKLLNLLHLGVAGGVSEMLGTVFKLVNAVCIALILLAVPDYLWQRREHLQSLKMSIPEMKEERKQEEGDPFVRQRIMQKSRELAQRNLPAAVRKADVVVTNPTHLAIALSYDQALHDEPVVVAKGADHLAHVIRQLATEAGVPIVENKPLAWAMWEDVEVGEPIPGELFETVAFLYTKLEKFRTAMAGAASA